MTQKLVSVFMVAALLIGVSACEQAQQVLTSLPERDHVWVVDQNGVEVPIPGTWVVVSQTNPNTATAIGDSFTLPPELPHAAQAAEGTYLDGAGILWTKVYITARSGEEWKFLERVDTSVSPHRLYVVHALDADGEPTLRYGAYPFEVPGHNVVIREKQ